MPPKATAQGASPAPTAPLPSLPPSPPPWKLVDIGVNLTDGMYGGVYHGSAKHAGDLDDVLRRAAAVGVKALIITGGTLAESRAAIALAVQCNAGLGGALGLRCFATVGCHPTRCNEFARSPAEYRAALVELATAHRIIDSNATVIDPTSDAASSSSPGGASAERVVCAIGECGLDYDREHFCPREVQLPYFLEQIGIAEQTRLPLFLHNRNTGNDFLRIMREHRARFSEGAVHSFTGSAAEMQALAELALFIGVNGCSLKTEENLATVRTIPLRQLLLETDGPWCEVRQTHASAPLLTPLSKNLLAQWPVCKKEKFSPGCVVKGRNEPAHMVEVLDIVAALRAQELCCTSARRGTGDGEEATAVAGASTEATHALPAPAAAAHALARIVASNTQRAFGIRF